MSHQTDAEPRLDARSAGADSDDLVLPSPDRAPRAHPRRIRILLGLLVLVLLALAAGVIWMTRDQDNDDPWDPQNSGPSGGRAVAEVLRDQGVQVVIARNTGDLRQAAPDADTTVFVAGSGSLRPAAAESIRSNLDAAGSLVWLRTHGGAGGSVAQQVHGRCDHPLLRDITDFSAGVAFPLEPGWHGCFPVTDQGASVLAYHDREVLIGADRWIRNDHVRDGQNAAVALRLLGQHRRLVWFMPDSNEGRPEKPSPPNRPYPPAWLGPAVLQLFFVGAVVVLVRGRRLGRLAREPMPVIIRASETTLSRARLYRRSGDRAYAMSQLQRGSRRRLIRALSLPEDVTPEQLAEVLAARTGRPIAELGQILTATPRNDSELTTWAQALLDIEKEVIR